MTSSRASVSTGMVVKHERVPVSAALRHCCSTCFASAWNDAKLSPTIPFTSQGIGPGRDAQRCVYRAGPDSSPGGFAFSPQGGLHTCACARRAASLRMCACQPNRCPQKTCANHIWCRQYCNAATREQERPYAGLRIAFSTHGTLAVVEWRTWHLSSLLCLRLRILVKGYLHCSRPRMLL